MKPLPSLSNTLKASLISSSESVSFIFFVDHVSELGLGGVLAQGAHDGAKLLGGDGAIAVLVEEGEGLLELGDLFLSELIG